MFVYVRTLAGNFPHTGYVVRDDEVRKREQYILSYIYIFLPSGAPVMRVMCDSQKYLELCTLWLIHC